MLRKRLSTHFYQRRLVLPVLLVHLPKNPLLLQIALFATGFAGAVTINHKPATRNRRQTDRI
jgi:hypothetical protein